MSEEKKNKGLYISIVVGMSVCLPFGIGIGIMMNHLITGIIAANTAGIVLGWAAAIHNGN